MSTNNEHVGNDHMFTLSVPPRGASAQVAGAGELSCPPTDQPGTSLSVPITGVPPSVGTYVPTAPFTSSPVNGQVQVQSLPIQGNPSLPNTGVPPSVGTYGRTASLTTTPVNGQDQVQSLPIQGNPLLPQNFYPQGMLGAIAPSGMQIASQGHAATHPISSQHVPIQHPSVSGQVPFQGVNTPQVQAQLNQWALGNFFNSLNQFGLMQPQPQPQTGLETTPAQNSANSVHNTSQGAATTSYNVEHMDVDTVSQSQEYFSDTGDGTPQVGGSERVGETAHENSYRKAVALTFATLPDELGLSDAESDDSYASIGEVKDRTKTRDLYFPLANKAGYLLSKTFEQVKSGIRARAAKTGSSLTSPVGIFPGPPSVPNKEYTYKTYHIHGNEWQHADKIRSYQAQARDKTKQPLTGLSPPSAHVPDQSVLEWKMPQTPMSLNPSASVRMDRAVRSHVGVANSCKYIEKATFKHITEAKGLVDAALLCDLPQELQDRMSAISASIDKVHLLGEQLQRFSNDNLAIATDQMVLWTLLQRDKWLSQLPKEVSFETLLELRTADFSEGNLFPADLVAKAADEVRTRQKETITKAAHKRDAQFLASDKEAPKPKKPKNSKSSYNQSSYTNPYRGRGNRGNRGSNNVATGQRSVPAAAAGSAAQTATDASSTRGRGNRPYRGNNPYRGYKGRGRNSRR